MLSFLRILFLIVIGLSIHPANAVSQHIKYDSSYVQDRKTDLMVRAYGGYSFSGYKLDQKGFSEPVTYKSNNNFNIGLGITYRFLSISFSTKAPLVNNDNDRYGDTKSFDLQSNIYLRRFTIDIFTQFYEGYYLKNSDILSAPLPQGGYMLRPDLHTSCLLYTSDAADE